eukprot:scpid107965/ scgid0273/ 
MLQVLCGTVVCAYNTMDLLLCFRHYREAESKLRSLDVWCANKHVRNWLNAKWLSIPERWSRAWTEREYHHNVFSNNGIEAQNKVLKYAFLKTNNGKKRTLSETFTIIVEQFLPQQRDKYLK